MRAAVTILLATIAVHLIGAASVLGLAIGPEFIWGAPVFAIFGIWLIPIEVVLVSIQWCLVDPGDYTIRDVATAWLVTAPTSALLLAMIGPKVDGEVGPWALGYSVGALLGASASLLIVANSKYATKAI
jgi:hypothetical protein